MSEPRFYLFDKPEGISTFDLIRRHKKNIAKKNEKIGHFGTLDPFATGLVIIGVGGATRLNEYVHQYLPKTYYAKGLLGKRMDTADKTGNILSESSIDRLCLDKETVSNSVSKFLGEYWQRPPAYSAVKHEGKKLYQWIKEGKLIEKPAVKRTIFQIEVLSVNGNEIEFNCTCSSGTYIRVLFEDIASEILGEPNGHLVALRRTAYGPLNLDHPNLFKQNEYRSMEVEQLLSLDKIILPDERIKRFQNGLDSGMDQALQTIPGSIDSDLCWILDPDHRLIGVAAIEKSRLRPHIVYRVR